jgi:hypothetical protein
LVPGLLLSCREASEMSGVLLQKLRKKGIYLLFFLGTHGITLLLLMALLAAIILLD